MSIDVEFHFDFGSPNAYLAHCVIPAVEQRTGVKFRYVPILLGGVFKLTGNRSPLETNANIPKKFDYDLLEIQRFIVRHDLGERFTMNPTFPINSLALMRMAVAAMAHKEPIFQRYVEAVFEAMWSQQRKMDDPDVISEVLIAADLPEAQLLEAATDQKVKAQLLQLTESSVERGNFGTPTFFLGKDMYFGKDRIRDVEEAIQALCV